MASECDYDMEYWGEWRGGEGDKDKVEAGWNIKVKGYKLVCVI